ncbi:hypothetical protein PHYBLDRAFT_147604 [Phycomyces blakesleeanus NRRL 1555(-)]|uniref:Uncharacterized protein n=1 Tax=Phycomyces blakesleeanus (strain ATCC 8743b / DSM 1359 / FGSC 10004 / NBRC 33097 / NRRL 1555) TaxID=763407 RepID=A0A167LTW5_PHYB8|nr:hypothetical protein PHYBLDRAFT_147604 [Phycomyces blakesleeanus NRRL 1555(-)]OAD71094.1 hypothetical protein PHYBLDRAFT_147604 [Phycomyces blakesleeanus NRRL 1555(-)]|eukprot:XP_018289134.1 hypothetical protein PHYBLDRAFT_147604 [Phycomyces blakesleeanus NRRL 1555(-)]
MLDYDNNGSDKYIDKHGIFEIKVKELNNEVYSYISIFTIMFAPRCVVNEGQIVLIGFIYHVLKTHRKGDTKICGIPGLPYSHNLSINSISRFSMRLFNDWHASCLNFRRAWLLHHFVYELRYLILAVNIVSFKPSGGITYLFGATYLANNNLSYSKRLNPKNLILAGLIARPKKPKSSAINSHSNPFADGL